MASRYEEISDCLEKGFEEEGVAAFMRLFLSMLFWKVVMRSSMRLDILEALMEASDTTGSSHWRRDRSSAVAGFWRSLL